MDQNTKRTLLYIQDIKSAYDSQTPQFEALFAKVDKILTREEAQHCIEQTKYDTVVADLSVDPERIKILKEIKDKKTGAYLFALVSEKDSDKLFGISELGINAFELLPSQFEQALEVIADFNPAQYQD